MLTPDDLDGSWFETVLAIRYPGVRVAKAEITKVDEWTNCHVRVDLTYAGSASAPARVFVKLPPRDARKAQAVGAARMGAREARFYTELAPAVDLRVPTPHGAVIEDDGGFAIVLEDLADSGCRPFNARPVDPDAAAVALEDLARMHVRYEDPARRTSPDVAWVDAPRLPPPGAADAPNATPNWGQILLRKGIDEQRDRLGSAYVAVAEHWIARRAELQALWWDAPLTVIHNDCHPGNLFDDHGRVGFFDWGLMCLGDPLRDASYFVCLALDTDVRREHERALLQTYLDARRALGGRAIDFDVAWQRHRLHAAYTVPASCQALDVPPDSSASARAFSDVFLARAIAAVEDLESPQAIQEASR